MIGEALYHEAEAGQGDRGFGMNYRHIAFAGALICTASAVPPAAGAAEPRAVIELFTSQGCSSCPAADKLLGELSRDPTLVTLSLPVDYWDYLGWKDTLALHGHSNRERAYADARGDREVYTPQVVVNGLVPVLGSDKAAIEHAIAQTRQSAAPLTLPVTLTVADGKVIGECRRGDRRRARQRRSLALPDHRQGAGRHRARREPRPHADLHQRRAPLGEARRLDRQGGNFQRAGGRVLPNAEFSLQDIDRVAVVVQSGVAAKPGLMLGAAVANLH